MSDLTFEFEEYVPPAKAPHALLPVVQSIIDAGPGFVAKTVVADEAEAKGTLKALQNAARELGVGIRRVSIEAEGKKVALRVRIGDAISRERKTPEEGDTAPVSE